MKRNSYQIKEKYESLRDIDSPVKEVSQMKKLIKQNDISIEKLNKEKQDLNKKINESFKLNEELMEKTQNLEIENEHLKSSLQEINDK